MNVDLTHYCCAKCCTPLLCSVCTCAAPEREPGRFADAFAAFKNRLSGKVSPSEWDEVMQAYKDGWRDCLLAEREAPPQPRQEDGAQTLRDRAEAPFEAWWEREGQFTRAGGGDYEKTFAWNAYCAALSQPAAQSEREAVPETLRQALAELVEALPDVLPAHAGERFRVTGKWASGNAYALRGHTGEIKYRADDMESVYAAMDTARRALASLPAESPAPEVADALRYRFMRTHMIGTDDGLGFQVDDEVEAAIDAALAASPKPPQGKMKEG